MWFEQMGLFKQVKQNMMKLCRINLLLMGLFATVLGLSMTSEAAPNTAKRPNVIVLFADDLGYGELSCQGNKEIPTPHIDSIAANECARSS